MLRLFLENLIVVWDEATNPVHEGEFVSRFGLWFKKEAAPAETRRGEWRAVTI